MEANGQAAYAQPAMYSAGGMPPQPAGNGGGGGCGCGGGSARGGTRNRSNSGGNRSDRRRSRSSSGSNAAPPSGGGDGVASSADGVEKADAGAASPKTTPTHGGERQAEAREGGGGEKGVQLSFDELFGEA